MYGGGWFGDGRFGERIMGKVSKVIKEGWPWWIPTIIFLCILLFGYIAYAGTTSDAYPGQTIPEVGDSGPGYATNIEGWMKSVDSDINDGTLADDTTYSAGNGISLAATVFSIDNSVAFLESESTAHNADTNVHHAPLFSALGGSATDSQVPDDITVDEATALAANGGNCAAGEIALGVDASGAVEGCYEPTVSDITDIGSNYQPLDATLTDIADGTITENLVNTANPWADNEVANDITVTLDTITSPSASSTITMPADVTFGWAWTNESFGINDDDLNLRGSTPSLRFFDDDSSADDYKIINVSDTFTVQVDINDDESFDTVFEVDNSGVVTADGGYASGVADGQRVMNANNSANPTSTVINEGDIWTAGGVPRYATLDNGPISAFYTSGTTDVRVADGGTGSSTAVAARANLEAPPPFDSATISGSALTQTTYPIGQMPVAITITGVTCITDAGTVWVDIHEGTSSAYSGQPSIMDSPIVCTTSSAAAVTISNGTIDADDHMALRIGTEASSPTIVGVTWEYTVD